MVFQNVGRTECERPPRFDGHLNSCFRISAYALSFVADCEGAKAGEFDTLPSDERIADL